MSIKDYFLIALCVGLVTACADTRLLMPTPNVYVDSETKLFEALPEEYMSPLVEVIYVTDRAPETDEEGNLRYGYNRSNSLAFGTAVVNLGKNSTWEDLVKASKTKTRVAEFELELVSIDEFSRLPPTPTPYRIVDDETVDDPEVTAAIKVGTDKLAAEVSRRLALTSRKDAFIFVHGYHNTFDDAAFALSELWHFFGREGLPIMYTWPAGYPGIFGYTYDRESSEFTVFHLKQVIKWLAEHPDIENIHIIAHSRGTDVAISAFRELVIWARGAGVDPREYFKVENFVIAAPDIDLQVMSQRVVAERLILAIDEGTLYTSPDDKAIGFAESLFASPRGRLGTVGVTDLSRDESSILETVGSRMTVINFDGEAAGYGHSYFRDHPAVSSDLVLKIRYGIKPGEAGRPLESLGNNFWRIPEGYPANETSE